MDPALKLGLILLCMITIFITLGVIAHLMAAFNAGKGDISIGLVAMNARHFWHHWPPADDDRLYEVGAGLTFFGGNGFPRKTERVRGKRKAYVMARKLAVQVEEEEKFRNPRMSMYEDGSYPNSIGVYWEMAPIDEKEPENAEKGAKTA